MTSQTAKNRDFFRAVFERSIHGICITDLQRKIILTNPEMANLTGYSQEELAGRSVLDLYPKDARNGLDLEALRRDETIVDNFQLRKKRKGEVPVRVRYTIIGQPAGGEVIVETYSDLSDRLRFDELKNEFVFIAAHELRSPVTAIKLLLDIIFEDRRLTVDPSMREYLLKLQEASERLTRLVDDLVEVSRTESNRLKIDVTAQDMTAHIGQAISEIRPTAVGKGVTIKYAPDGPVPRVMADSLKLKEILSNLLSNAVKYNVTDGEIRITHAVRNSRLYTTVADTGIGISEEDQKRLFQKFWRSEDLAVRSQAGTGLGLFIIRELAVRMGGDVSVRSEHGEGTAFTFSLPVA